MTLDRYILLGSTMLTDVHFSANSIGNLGQVDGRIVLVTDLTLHN
jgi:DNA integrity scanning protein DisA with diadenylate cyclase activity